MSLEFDPTNRICKKPKVSETEASALVYLSHALPGSPEPYGADCELDEARKIVWKIPPADIE